VLLTGGGTGGHVYPILAIRKLLGRRFTVLDTLYVGSAGRAEEKIVPRLGITIRYVASAPFSGLSPWKLVPALAKNLLGTVQALFLLLRFRPHLVLASGGYVSAPVCFATYLVNLVVNVPLVVDEQNVMPGLMNKLASLFARVVMVSFRETAAWLWSNRCVYTGYPVREEFLKPFDRSEARRALSLPEDRFVVLVYGGSLGSRSINRLMAATLPRLPELGRRVLVIHSTGMGSPEYAAWLDTDRVLRDACPRGATTEVTEAHTELRLDGGSVAYRLVPYLHDIVTYMAAADLVVCRAGAGTIAEITAMGKPAIVVPKRDLPGNHQEHNAIILAEQRGCEVLFERCSADGVDYVDPDELWQLLRGLAGDPERAANLAQRARDAAVRDADTAILDTISDVLAGTAPELMPDLVVPKWVQVQSQVDRLVGFLRDAGPDSFYRRLYSIKMEEWLAAKDWRRINDGIKLAGALQRRDLTPTLERHFRTGTGFMRRNVLQALQNMGEYSDRIPELVDEALDDNYFEVRSAAFSLAAAYHQHIRGQSALVAKMAAVVDRRVESFEVRVQALRCMPLLVSFADYQRLAWRFRYAANVRYRQAILDGIKAALDASLMEPPAVSAARRFISDMLVTTSHFAPQFRIRESFRALATELEERSRRGGDRR
jgi:UDP-N-acetylglucosamine--N-acetylmuramyl-(pentapeptide) pyrophosphoryl-undecaprenol N-acetylglucosamine transferase